MITFLLEPPRAPAPSSKEAMKIIGLGVYCVALFFAYLLAPTPRYRVVRIYEVVGYDEVLDAIDID